MITSLDVIKRKYESDKFGTSSYNQYENVKTIMYESEQKHFKNQIIVSNMHMIDECDTLICYVNESIYTSGAKRVLNYAKKKCKRIINLFYED